MTASLQAETVSFAYGATVVLHDISLSVPLGGLTAILGPNGSGKTTLLRLLGGLLRPSAGRITLGNDDLSAFPRAELARRMAMVPQETHLAFDYSVLEIVLMGRYPHMGPLELEGPADLRIARNALSSTGTLDLELRGFMTLSGGEKQRVIIASALAQLWHPPTTTGVETEPGFLLLDEPTVSLDLGSQLDITATLQSLNQGRGITMVISTHDLNLAASLCNHLVLLRKGRILAAGSTDRILTTETVRQLYDVEADVRRHTDTGHLTVVPVSRSNGRRACH